MIGAFGQDDARGEDVCLHKASEQSWLFMPHGTQLVMPIEELSENRGLIYSSLAQDRNGALLSSLISTIFIEDIYK